MSESVVVSEEVKQEVVTPANPFAEGAWKNEPAPVAPAAAAPEDPAIKEKDEKIKEEKPTSDKPNEPEKIPGASPAPIQDRPADPPKQEIAAPEPIKFANEESERVFNLLKEGKTEDVLAVLSEQKKLKEVDKLPAADIIKLNLQYQNKDFTSEEINDLFAEKYSFPEKPVQNELTESDDEFAERVSKYEKEVQKIEARIKRDSKPAVAELLKLQKEIVLPDIPKQKVEEQAAELTQEELDARKAWNENFLKSVEDGVQKFKGYETKFKDEEVELNVAYVPSDDDRKELQPVIALAGTDAAGFMQKLGWVDDKGNINTAKIAEDLPFILNKEKVLNKMVSETGNKRHEASIKSIKNIDFSGKQKSNGDLGANPQELQGRMATHFFSN